MNISRLRRATALLAGLALVAGAAACGGDDDGSDGNSLTVATVAADSGAQGFLADEKGFFEEHGLDVEVQIVAGVPELAAAVQSDRADIALTSPTSIASANASGIPFRVVAGGSLYTEERPGTWLMVANQATGIQSLADLAGKAVAVNALNTLPHLSTMATLDDAGIDVSTMEFVTLDFPSIGQALESGQVPAGAVVSPYHDQQEAAGIATPVVSPYDAVNDKGDFLNTVWFGKEDFIADNPDLVADFQAALRTTNEWANDPANEDERKSILQDYNDLSDEALELMELSYYGDDATPELLQPLLDVMHRFGALEEPMDAQSIIGEGVQ